ncbi:MAG: hypothetical protein QOE45_1735 [Frankiaceae bacterium]|jgi:Zn-dependent peptidase ImmA (M78 family)/DNA-binding XRE family transcriptional regulator|nr:hypothetical protein [Frankiaceae bacterium]
MTARVVPEMIRLARVSRRFSQKQVALAIGVQQPAYSKIETGQARVSDAHLSALSETLGYPSAFFYQTERIWGTASPHHRRRKSLGNPQLEQIEAELNIVRLNIRRLTDGVELTPLFAFPTLDLDEVGTPAEAARQVRRLWRQPSGPIANMTRLLEDAGVVIVEWPYQSDKIDAVSVWGPGEAPVVLVNASFPGDRLRLTIAHEAGHLITHATDVTPDPEGEANAFASEFLMPEADIRHELRGLRIQDLPDLKRRWKCSMRAIVYRAQQLEEISKDQARYMYMRLNKMYGAKHEPIDIPREHPGLLRELLTRHTDELGYTVEDLASLVIRLPEDFEQTYGVGKRHLRSL